MISLLLGATAGAVAGLAGLAVVAAAGGPTGTGFEVVGYLIRAVVFGSAIALGVLARGAVAHAVAPGGHPAPRPPDGLTSREVEVLGFIAWGHTNREIAEQLCLSVRTIESHRRNIQGKLDLSTRAELVRYARDRRLISS
jgi:DNA-binding NarL/FixJ family response regulator